MAVAANKGKPAKRGSNRDKDRGPEWTSGLKRFYDSVVDEPIPDAFRDLLAKLDDGKK